MRKRKLDLSAPSYKAVYCDCGKLVDNVSMETVRVTCMHCLLSKIPRPVISQPKVHVLTGRPQGWHFMKVFVDKNGNVFYRGVEQPKLKGTLPSTKIDKTKKKKKRTKDEILLARHKKKQKALGKKPIGRPKKTK